MNYIIRGNLCGFLCNDCSDPLYGMLVKLYLPWQKDRVLSATVANTKETFRLVAAEEAAARKDLLIATAQTDEKGNFEFSINENFTF